MAFGTNHGAAIGEDGMLYTWGHNQTQQLGISLDQYEKGLGQHSHANKQFLAARVHDASINKMLRDNKEKLNEDGVAGQANAADTSLRENEEEEEKEPRYIIED